ncbi:MAG: DUF4071 domain-containing protein [Actinobacteria bacterium]|nr:DUF4071 domain-containing protein [Actinomycetota bacterium]
MPIPGTNAVTLMEISDPLDPRRHDLLLVVSYAAERRSASGEADYWDHATRLELAGQAKAEAGAQHASGSPRHGPRGLGDGIDGQRPELISQVRKRRGELVSWAGLV